MRNTAVLVATDLGLDRNPPRFLNSPLTETWMSGRPIAHRPVVHSDRPRSPPDGRNAANSPLSAARRAPGPQALPPLETRSTATAAVPGANLSRHTAIQVRDLVDLKLDSRADGREGQHPLDVVRAERPPENGRERAQRGDTSPHLCGERAEGAGKSGALCARVRRRAVRGNGDEEPRLARAQARTASSSVAAGLALSTVPNGGTSTP